MSTEIHEKLLLWVNEEKAADATSPVYYPPHLLENFYAYHPHGLPTDKFKVTFVLEQDQYGPYLFINPLGQGWLYDSKKLMRNLKLRPVVDGNTFYSVEDNDIQNSPAIAGGWRAKKWRTTETTNAFGKEVFVDEITWTRGNAQEENLETVITAWTWFIYNDDLEDQVEFRHAKLVSAAVAGAKETEYMKGDRH